MLHTLETVITITGQIAMVVVCLAALLVLVAHAMPAPPPRSRAIPKGCASDRVTQVEINRAHAESTAADMVHRQELAEGRLAC